MGYTGGDGDNMHLSQKHTGPHTSDLSIKFMRMRVMFWLRLRSVGFVRSISEVMIVYVICCEMSNKYTIRFPPDVMYMTTGSADVSHRCACYRMIPVTTKLSPPGDLGDELQSVPYGSFGAVKYMLQHLNGRILNTCCINMSCPSVTM